MNRFLILIVAGLAVSACGQSPANAPSEAVEAPAAVIAPAVQPAPALTIEDSCRQAVERLYGQTGTAVTFDQSDFSVSWPAPVDGGRLRFACNLVGSQITLANERQSQTVDLASPTGAPDSENSVGGN